MVECKTSFECWTWNCSAHNYSWTRKKQPKHSTRKYPRNTDDFFPIFRKQRINSWRSDQETRTVGDFLTDTRKAGCTPQRFFFFGGKILDAKSFSSLQRRTNKNENCCRNWFLAPEKLGHCSLLLMRMDHPLKNLNKSAIPSDSALAISSAMQWSLLLGVLCCEFNKLSSCLISFLNHQL